MRKGSTVFVLILMLGISACGPQRAAESTPQPTATGAVAVSTPAPLLPSATSAPMIAARRSATPFVFPAAADPAPICDNAPPTYLILHERARVTNDDPKPLNVRDKPGLNGKVVGQLETLDIFMIIDGPRCANDYTWFKVRAGNVEGWVAEGDTEMYYMEPYMP